MGAMNPHELREWEPSKRRTPIRNRDNQRKQRQLRDDEPLPAGAILSSRSLNSYGYWQLWWRVPGQKLVVGRSEHRHVMFELGYDLAGKEVHHINRDRGDNRPCNLEVLTPKEHGERHRKTEGGQLLDSP